MSADTVIVRLYAVILLSTKVYGLIGKSIVQPNALVTAQLGDSVTLPCFCPSGQVSFVAWFKQTIGQKLHHIATARGYVSDVQFFNEFKESTRITAQRGTGTFNLTVSKIEASDSATYYCAMAFLSEFSFGDGALLIVMGSKAASKIVIQQPVSEPLQPGDSVTLQCSVHTETCAGEHSVYWFRQASGESLPGIIYTHGNRSDQCERSSGAGSPTQSCVYKLPKRNLSRSDAGTYNCAVATCGEILFGNGTVVDFEGNEDGNMTLLFYSLVGTLTLSVILNIVLIYILNKRKGCENCKVCSTIVTKSDQTPWDPNSAGTTVNEGALTYAAVSFAPKKSKSRRRRESPSRSVVYSEMRCHQQD